MEPLHLYRLIQLADHLKRGQLGHKNFDFHVYNERSLRGEPGNRCGTNGCGMGECPFVFPMAWSFGGEDDAPILIHGNGNTLMDGMEFFGISGRAYEHLFIPLNQQPELFGGIWLNIMASRIEVADNMYEFIKRKLN